MALVREVVDLDDPLSVLLRPDEPRVDEIPPASKHSNLGCEIVPAVSITTNPHDDEGRSKVRPLDPPVAAESWLGLLHHEPCMLRGERPTLDKIPCGLISYSGVCVNGRVMCTNYQLMFLPSSDNLALKDEDMDMCNLHLPISYYKIPLCCIERIERSQRNAGKIVVSFASKDCRMLRLQFPVFFRLCLSLLRHVIWPCPSDNGGNRQRSVRYFPFRVFSKC
jgi:hypothetical protein